MCCGSFVQRVRLDGNDYAKMYTMSCMVGHRYRLVYA